MRVTPMQWVLALVLAAVSGPTMACPDNIITTGNACRIEVSTNLAAPTVWGYLQAFQVALRSKDAQGKLNVIGCETNKQRVTCDDVENGIFGSPPKALSKVKKLTYWVADSDWNGNKTSYEQWIAAALDDLRKDDPSLPGRFAIKYTEATPPQPACTSPDDYIQPCYNRPICVQYGGCSKKTTSCAPCTPAP